MVLKGRGKLKPACKGFFMAQSSFCKRYLLESDTDRLRFYFFLSFFLSHALGKLQKLNRKYEIWKFKKKAQNLPKVAKKKNHTEKQKTFCLLLIIPNLTH